MIEKLEQSIEELSSLKLALGEQEYLKQEEPENYKLSQALDTALEVLKKELSKKASKN